MVVYKTCETCGSRFKRYAAKGMDVKTIRFCSLKCKGKAGSPKGPDSARWIDGPRKKKCEYCGEIYKCGVKKPYSSFLKQKFCSKECVRKGQKRLYGDLHPKYNPNRDHFLNPRTGTSHQVWSNAVKERDNYTCQLCGKRGGYLHAHHIKSYTFCEDGRHRVDNGVTLCVPCHRNIHKDDFYGNQYVPGSIANGVNSGEAQNG